MSSPALDGVGLHPSPPVLLGHVHPATKVDGCSTGKDAHIDAHKLSSANHPILLHRRLLIRLPRRPRGPARAGAPIWRGPGTRRCASFYGLNLNVRTQTRAYSDTHACGRAHASDAQCRWFDCMSCPESCGCYGTCVLFLPVPPVPPQRPPGPPPPATPRPPPAPAAPPPTFGCGNSGSHLVNKPQLATVHTPHMQPHG